jgi:hypothetical protein
MCRPVCDPLDWTQALFPSISIHRPSRSFRSSCRAGIQSASSSVWCRSVPSGDPSSGMPQSYFWDPRQRPPSKQQNASTAVTANVNAKAKLSRSVPGSGSHEKGGLERRGPKGHRIPFNGLDMTLTTHKATPAIGAVKRFSAESPRKFQDCGQIGVTTRKRVQFREEKNPQATGDKGV